jgi:hypothetical protein
VRPTLTCTMLVRECELEAAGPERGGRVRLPSGVTTLAPNAGANKPSLLCASAPNNNGCDEDWGLKDPKSGELHAEAGSRVDPAAIAEEDENILAERSADQSHAFGLKGK